MNFRLKDRFLYQHKIGKKSLNESNCFSNTKRQKFKAKIKAGVDSLTFKFTKTPCEITIHVFKTLRLTNLQCWTKRVREVVFSPLTKDSTDFRWHPQAQCSPSSTGPRTCSSCYIRYHSPACQRTLVLWQTVLNTQITTLALDALLHYSLEQPSLPMDIIQNCWALWQNHQ